jgi:serine/threonine protein kinase
MQPENFGNNLVLFEKLASGGMGEVFKAKQIGTEGFEKTVAVKRILPHFAARDDFSRLFKQEMWLAAKLQHSNIAQVFSNGAFAEYLYLVMEFVSGKTLAEVLSLCTLRKSPLTVAHCCYIISEAAKGLHYAHTLREEGTGAPLNIVHRDVSPQNIMCTENGEVKIVDFGIAKVFDKISDLSRVGDVKGKMQYVAPEQLEGKRATAQSDIFSLGATLFELLTLQPLFLSESPYHTISNIMTMDVPNLADFREDVPEELQAILTQALAKDPSHRFHTAEDFHRHLSQFISSHYPSYSSTELGRTIRHIASKDTPETSQSEEGSPSAPLGSFVTRTFSTATLRREKRRTRLLAAGLVVALCGFGIIGALIATRERTRPVPPPRISEPIAVLSAADVVSADDGKVASWIGGGRLGQVQFEQPLEESRPLLIKNAVGTNSVLRFEGRQFLTSTSVAATMTTADQATFIVVARMAPDRIGYLLSMQQANWESDVFRLGTDDSSHLRVKTTEASGNRMFVTAERKYNGDLSVISVSIDGGGVRIFINGRLQVPGPLPYPVAFDKSAIMSIGQEFDRGRPTDFLVGDIAEIQIYDSSLPNSYRSGIEQRLSQRYGIHPQDGK